MLQLFHLSVAKVDLDVGLLSEEERASAHGGGDVKEGGVIRVAWKRRARHRCGRDGAESFRRHGQRSGRERVRTRAREAEHESK
jgi:hypothetical protein